MRASTAIVFAAASLFSTASAGIYITNPVSTTTCAAGTTCMVAWNDDGQQPALAQIGPCVIELCSGGVTQQTCFQTLSNGLDVSTSASLTYTVPATLGPSSNEYFVRFTSTALKSTANPQYPYQAFSAKYTLSGMSGTFAPSVLSEISAMPTAAGAATTPAAAATTTAATSMVTSTAKPASAASSTGSSKTTSTAAAAKTTSGAFTVGTSFTGMSLALAIVGALAFTM